MSDDPVLKAIKQTLKAQTPRGRLLRIAKIERFRQEAEALLEQFPDFKHYPARTGFEVEEGLMAWQINTLEQRAARWLEYERTAEHVIRDERRQHGTRKKRRSRWAELDAAIRAELDRNPDASAKDIFATLPESYSGDAFYTDGLEVCKPDGATLGFSGFETRVSNIRKSRKSG